MLIGNILLFDRTGAILVAVLASLMPVREFGSLSAKDLAPRIVQHWQASVAAMSVVAMTADLAVATYARRSRSSFTD